MRSKLNFWLSGAGGEKDKPKRRGSLTKPVTTVEPEEKVDYSQTSSRTIHVLSENRAALTKIFMGAVEKDKPKKEESNESKMSASRLGVSESVRGSSAHRISFDDSDIDKIKASRSISKRSPDAPKKSESDSQKKREEPVKPASAPSKPKNLLLLPDDEEEEKEVKAPLAALVIKPSLPGGTKTGTSKLVIKFAQPRASPSARKTFQSKEGDEEECSSEPEDPPEWSEPEESAEPTPPDSPVEMSFDDSSDEEETPRRMTLLDSAADTTSKRSKYEELPEEEKMVLQRKATRVLKENKASDVSKEKFAKALSAFEELLDTEESYIQGLVSLNEHFVKGLTALCVLKGETPILSEEEILPMR